MQTEIPPQHSLAESQGIPPPPARRRFARLRSLVSGTGKLAHILAFVLVLVALDVLLLGGFRVQWSGVTIRSTSLGNPLLFALGLTLIGKALVPSVPLNRAPILRWFGPFFAWTAWRRATPLVRAARLCVLAGLVTLSVKHLRHQLLVKEAARLEAQGENLQAAELYGDAATWWGPNVIYHLCKQTQCLYRAGHFEEGIAVLYDRFKRGVKLENFGYSTLWRCQGQLGRYADAMETVRTAMALYPSLSQTCTSSLALYTRKLNQVPDDPVRVNFSYTAPADAHGPFFLSGNWSAQGRPSEILGWEPQAMEAASDGRTWSLQVALDRTQELPFTAVVSPSPVRLGAAATGMALFWVPAERAERTLDVRVEALPLITNVAPAAQRVRPADGRRRVLALWPDCGSWFIFNLYAQQGVLPNFTRLMSAGTRMEMISTSPPFTSTAYLRMVEMKPGTKDSSQRSLWQLMLLQAKGLPVLDSLIPFEGVAGESADRRTIFSVLADHKLGSVNLVFGDKYVSAANDLQAQDGKHLDLDEDVLAQKNAAPSAGAQALIADILHIDREREPQRAERLLSDMFFVQCIENTQHKADYGFKAWHDLDPDFMLLRFPAIDWMSHKNFGTIEDSPASNVMQETYRHLDGVIGQFVPALDADDTLILVSDHGIYGTLHHHPSCVLVMEGPQLPAGESLGTIPIGWFPCAVLSRFGIDEGSERLNTELNDFFYARTDPSRTGAHTPGPALIAR